MGSLNIGNRSTDFKRNKPTGTILNEDVIEQRSVTFANLYRYYSNISYLTHSSPSLHPNSTLTSPQSQSTLNPYFRILGNGELYTCKLITKKIGNSNSLLRRLGIRFPESTTVVEHSFVNTREEHSWQWTQNIGLEYYYGQGLSMRSRSKLLKVTNTLATSGLLPVQIRSTSGIILHNFDKPKWISRESVAEFIRKSNLHSVTFSE